MTDADRRMVEQAVADRTVADADGRVRVPPWKNTKPHTIGVSRPNKNVPKCRNIRTASLSTSAIHHLEPFTVGLTGAFRRIMRARKNQGDPGEASVDVDTGDARFPATGIPHILDQRLRTDDDVPPSRSFCYLPGAVEGETRCPPGHPTCLDEGF